MPTYAVYYASTGCLPDGDEVPTFNSLWLAAEHVAQEWLDEFDACSGTDDAQSDDAREMMSRIADTDNESEVFHAAALIGIARGIGSPRAGSLYRWTIEAI